MYYLTVYNEPMPQPAEPEGLDVEGVVKGIYQLKRSEAQGPRVQLLASGVGVPWVLEAQELLEKDWGVAADVWSVTSWAELRRDGLKAEHDAFLAPDADRRTPFVTERLQGTEGPVLGVGDWAHSVPDQIRQFVPRTYVTLGADDFGFSDTRAAARRFFHIDGPSIVVRALEALADEGRVDPHAAAQAIDRYRLHDVNAGTSGAAGGES
jgi:pyruvate dehydrogenase E1 component